MTDSKIRKLVLAALMAALCTIMTMVIQVPSPMQGYVNLGDCAVLMSAWVLGPLYGGAAAGIGSALADLLSGYAHYVPGTFAIKLVMAVAAALIFRAATKKGLSASSVLLGQIVGGVVAEVIMVLGYFAYASLWLGKGLAAAASIPGNIVQGVFGVAAATVIYTGKLGSLKRFKDDVKEVVVGQDCGLNIESFNDIRVGDIVEGYEQVEVKRK